ncbi:sulfate transporter family-domain-containing protein [Halteromyces radiatus]|uniref:sulfate transporter family-domain-containing protein n=1 Tax=Halteromyces radiatus TaxID=101107 RepID=UPI002220C2D1|nr:sulfate transporter family-domain-containing protein [Halteromyces radiatus]KAI8089337.1 sulfate transporter family-domain-containing protein [Halteromyces radiatus]
MNSIVIDYEQDSFYTRLKHKQKKLPWLLRSYVTSFFPIFRWIHRYNISWLIQDMIAGITVGIVLVPQSMAYAKIANLEPQYGLYSSFVGVSIYCFFGTSKDISIGLISTVSLLVGQAVLTVKDIYPDITGPQVAMTLSLIVGIITLAIGISRLGILWPKIFGLSNVDTHQPPYIIFLEFFKNIRFTKLDVAFGLTSLVILYLVRSICQYISSRKHLSKKVSKSVFYFCIMRNGLVVIFGTLISYIVNRNKSTSVISIIRNVPAGFDAMAVPVLDYRVLRASASIVPSIIIIMILEHVSVAKSFGRVYDYNIEPNQEIFAIGISNIVGSFFGGAPSTGAFSRTAIMAKSGVRTPGAGIFSGIVVILALYVLTPCFYYIPDAVLAAVVIHAVCDLASSPRYLKKLFKTSILEFLVWLSAVIITICMDVQSGIYTAVGISLMIMLFRMARPPVKLLARIPLSPISQQLQSNDQGERLLNEKQPLQNHPDQRYIYVDERDINFAHQCHPLPPGILVFRLSESILYPNAEYVSEFLLKGVKSRTRCGNRRNMEKSSSDLAWNENLNKNTELHRVQLPVLRAIVLDFTAVTRLDSTALQILANLRSSIGNYSGREVEWHFVGLQHHQLRRSLIYYGFGVEHRDGNNTNEHPRNKQERQQQQINYNSGISGVPQDRYPYFHWDIDTAVNSIWKRWHINDHDGDTL